jgi:tripeptide aminopeptidase
MSITLMSPVSRTPAEATSTLRQEIADLAALPQVCKASRWFGESESAFSDWQLIVAAIPAPPFGEEQRAAWLAAKFDELGLADVGADAAGNVIGVLPGYGPAISISAHMDTVFPAGTNLSPRLDLGRLYGPGISDNAAGITALLAIAAAFVEFRLPHSLPLLFVANVGEEGEGDLRGMRHLFESDWKDKISASVIIDGAGTDTIIADALGSRRFEVTIEGPGGHSWTDFGAPNPIVALGRAIQLFSETRVPASPKTTFNVGVISGGTSVNSIPESASMRVDIRSSSLFEIERLELELRRAVEHAVRSEQERESGNKEEKLSSVVKVIGNRPAGELDRKSRILQLVRAVDSHLGNSSHVQRASTDANIPISLKREAVALGGGGRGGGAHTLQEWFDPAGRELGLRRILLLVLALASGNRNGAGK